jgi:hypothetical protein
MELALKPMILSPERDETIKIPIPKKNTDLLPLHEMRSSEEVSNKLLITDSSIDRSEIPNLIQIEKKAGAPPSINIVKLSQRRPSAMISNTGNSKNHPAKVVRIME